MEESVIADIRSALERHGLPPARIERLGRPGVGRKAGRHAFRVDLTSGSVIKARVFESVTEAARLADLRSRLDDTFAPIISRDGPILLETWIAGAPLTDVAANERAEELGALLGRLHATPIPEGSARRSTRARRELSAGQLAVLVEAGLVTVDQAQTLDREMVRRDPGAASPVIIHGDYRPENLVVDGTGRLRVIDNEWVRIEAAGVDLGLTYARWTMRDEVWRDFLRGYRAAAPCVPESLPFWLIATAISGAFVRMQTSAATLAVPLARLRALAAAPAPSAAEP